MILNKHEDLGLAGVQQGEGVRKLSVLGQSNLLEGNKAGLEVRAENLDALLICMRNSDEHILRSFHQSISLLEDLGRRAEEIV